MSIYNNSKYLSSNPSWHTEDSSYKASLVQSALDSLPARPISVIDYGCGAGQVSAILAQSNPDKRFIGL